MRETVTLSRFRDAFHARNRGDNFSYEGLEALFNHIEEYEEGADIEWELDVIALCCDFTEYESLEEFHKDYDKEDYPDLETLQDHTQVIPFGNESFIIQQF